MSSTTPEETMPTTLDDLAEGATIYHLAVENRDTATLLLAKEDDLLKVDRDMETPLHYAAVNDDLEICYEKILDIWFSAKSLKIRKMLNQSNRNFTPCNVCDVDGTLIGEKNSIHFN